MSTQTTTVSLNVDYLKSKQGTLRILEAIIGLCGVICVSQGAYCGHYGLYQFYNFVVVTTLILSIIVLVIYVLSIDKMCTIINCFMSVLINDVIFSILYLVATICIIITIGGCTPGQIARIFATLFGIFGTVDVGLLALIGYQAIKTGTAPKSEGV